MLTSVKQLTYSVKSYELKYKQRQLEIKFKSELTFHPLLSESDNISGFENAEMFCITSTETMTHEVSENHYRTVKTQLALNTQIASKGLIASAVTESLRIQHMRE